MTEAGALVNGAPTSATFDNTTDSLEAISNNLDVPAADSTDNVEMSDVLGNKTDAGAAGDVSGTESVMAYAKQAVTEISGSAGIATYPAGAIAANGVSIAEVLRHADEVVGADNADNSFASTNVAANRDGSVLERQEDIRDQINPPSGAYIPGYGTRVTKVSDLASDPDALFDVTGKVMITMITGEVTTVVATTTTAQLRVATTNEVLTAASTITTDAAGTMYLVTGDPADSLNGGGTPTTRVAGNAGDQFSPMIVGLASGSLTIEQDLDAAGTGNITWDLYFYPLEASATVAAAA